MRAAIFLFVFLPLVSLAGTYTVDDVPNPKRQSLSNYVSDPDHYLTGDEISTINSMLLRLEDSTTAQVAVVVLESIDYLVPKEFATELFRKWGIGQADVNNGLLILMVIDQRRMEFETGYGLEPVLTDGVCKRIQVERMVPLAKEGRYGQALIDGIEEVNRILMDPRYREEILSTTDAYGNDTRSFLRKPVSPGWLIGLGLPWILFQWLGWNSEKKGIKKAPAYVKSNFSSMTSASRRTFLGVGLPAALVSSQLMTGMLRVGEFLLILYGILILLTIIKRYRLNHWITQHTEGKEAYTVHQQMQQSHSNGWGAAAIFMPVPMLGYWIWYKRNQHKLRNTPPLSSSGIPMEKLDEKSDDAYLKDVQITEEKIKSIDYDVWLDRSSGETTVYRYDLGKSAYTTCKNCGGKTRKHTKTETLVAATYTSTGKGQKTYTCKHCGDITYSTFTIAMKTASSGSGSGGSGGGGGGGGSFGGGSSGGGGAGSSW